MKREEDTSTICNNDKVAQATRDNGTVPWKDWNLGTIPETSNFDIYYLDDVPTGSTIVATLVWYRYLELVWLLWSVKPLSDLDLVLFEGAVGVYRSESTIDNVEHLYFTVDRRPLSARRWPRTIKTGWLLDARRRPMLGANGESWFGHDVAPH